MDQKMTFTKAFAITATACLITSAAATGAGNTQSGSWQSGMTQSSVFSMQADRRGNLWIATEDGLNRFDGRALHVYRNTPGDSKSLPENYVRAIHTGRKGRIWVATEGGGVAVWNPRTKTFRTHNRSTGLTSNYTRTVTRDRLGYIWVALRDGGLDRLDPMSGQVTNYRHNSADPNSLSDNNVFAVARARDNSLWVGTNSGLDRFNPDTGKFTRVLQSTSDSPMRVRALRTDRNGILWIGTRGTGLIQYNTRRNRVRYYQHNAALEGTLSSNEILSIYRDAERQLWIGTMAGLDRFDRKKRRFGHTELIGGSGTVLSMLEDHQGKLMAGTELGGIAHVHGRSDTAKQPLAGNQESGALDVVSSFAEATDGRLYVGTVGEGLALVDRATGNEQRFRHDPLQAGSLSGDRVMSLFRDSSDRLWVGTQRNGIDRLDPGATDFVNFRHSDTDSSSLSADGVIAFHEDSAGTIWVATYGGGLNAYNEAGGFVSYRHDSTDPASLSSDRLTAVIGAENGQVWVGTDGAGLSLFDPATGTARSFANDPMDPTTLPADTVCSLHVDASGTLWVGTRGGGVARMDSPPTESSEPVFTAFTESDGLPNSVVYGVRSDSSGNLWLSTNLGLSHFDPATQSFTNFDTSNGLASNEFNLGAVYSNASGELFFGSVQGFEAFFPDQILGMSAPEQAFGASNGSGTVVRASRSIHSDEKLAVPRIAGL